MHIYICIYDHAPAAPPHGMVACLEASNQKGMNAQRGPYIYVCVYIYIYVSLSLSIYLFIYVRVHVYMFGVGG